MPELVQIAVQRPHVVVFIVLFLGGLYITLTRPNIVKKLIGMYILQTSTVFFLVTISAKKGASVPILRDAANGVDPALYVNPLPHVLTLTAIVVQVATLGVSLALVAAIYRRVGSLDENEIARQLQ